MVSFFSEGRGLYIVYGDLYTLISSKEGASTWDAPCRCGVTLQHISTLVYGAEERSYIGVFIPDIKGFLLYPSSFDYDLSFPI